MRECPVCLRLDCQTKHRECSAKRFAESKAFAECVRCGSRLRVRVPDGLCGFCREEATETTDRRAA